MTIDLLTEQEIPEVCEIEMECFTHPWSEQSLRESYANPDARFFAAREDGKIIGYISAEIILDEGYIMNLAVRPEFRGRGAGKNLVKYIIKRFKNDLKFFTLEVRESNVGAISLYENLGFEFAGTRKKYYRNPTENALLFTLNFYKGK